VLPYFCGLSSLVLYPLSKYRCRRATSNASVVWAAKLSLLWKYEPFCAIKDIQLKNIPRSKGSEMCGSLMVHETNDLTVPDNQPHLFRKSQGRATRRVTNYAMSKMLRPYPARDHALMIWSRGPRQCKKAKRELTTISNKSFLVMRMNLLALRTYMRRTCFIFIQWPLNYRCCDILYFVTLPSSEPKLTMCLALLLMSEIHAGTHSVVLVVGNGMWKK